MPTMQNPCLTCPKKSQRVCQPCKHLPDYPGKPAHIGSKERDCSSDAIAFIKGQKPDPMDGWRKQNNVWYQFDQSGNVVDAVQIDQSPSLFALLA